MCQRQYRRHIDGIKVLRTIRPPVAALATAGTADRDQRAQTTSDITAAMLHNFY